MNNQWLSPKTLTGKNIKLAPMKIEHRDALVKAASDGNLWEIWHTSVPSEKSVDSYIKNALTEAAKGEGLPFVVIDLKTEAVIGSTRFCFADTANRRVEIGYTWYAKSYQRTGVNTECKYLLLSYAFEELKAIAVVFSTNWHNHTSRNAIARLGAKQDGVLRNHRVDTDGIIRDTVIFSIIENEWHSVKKNLEFKMKIYE
ncbi:MAG: GNAT family N-acetyltransferase [Spirosomaceae bacterium]|nr:GNAT family N-acetyltransferase [Spirosomataceae bacterium]